MDKIIKYDIFISYRRFDSKGRTSGRDIARTIKLELEKRGFKVFFDYSELRDNEFENIILPAVKNSKALLFILSEDALIRCSNEGDWVRREICTALETGVKIIPLNPDNAFNGWPENLPAELEPMKHQQFSDINMGSLFEKSIDKLIEDRLSPKKSTPSTPQELWESIAKDDYDQVMDFFQKVQTKDMSPELWKDAEKCFWNLTLKQESVNSLTKFKEILPKSKFAEEASKIVADCVEWESVKKSNDIFSVKVFLGKHNRVISKKEVTLLYDKLRSAEISKIKKDIKGFPVRRLGLLINQGCISEADFASEEWEVMKDIVVWESTDKKKIYSLREYLKDRPNSIFSKDAKEALDELRKEELYKMKESPEAYTSEIIFDYLHSNLFHPEELVEAGVATEESLQRMNTEYSRDSIYECSNDRHQVSDRCPEIYLFGLPYTGKTTIMSSLVGTSSNEYFLDMTGGNCMHSLWKSAEKRNFPKATHHDDLSVMYVNLLNNPQKKNSGYRKVNIIDIAGEDFCFKMVCNNSNADLERTDLSISTLLADNNPKAFFVIVDPTWISKPLINKRIMMDRFSDEYLVMKDEEFSQEYVLCRFFSILRSPENRFLMQKVKAINIIVTKADMLGTTVEERLNAAQNIIRESCGRSYHILEECCKYYGLPTPRIIPISIGKIYVGGVYEQETISVPLLIETIRESIGGYKLGFIDRMREWLRK